jgi:hypothetical protein
MDGDTALLGLRDRVLQQLDQRPAGLAVLFPFRGPAW